ncbi:MAG: terminase large subunit [Blautia sp.]|uniref:terminase large subunit n=1 Tax=Blautia sp. TaxID=1955243 RepID=UPI00260908DD|nr:terminase large subunit [Blautia sp.]MDD6413360.1 terminase large subunit [Blautia sp.]
MNYIREYYNKIQSGEVVVSEKVSKVYKKLLHEIEHPGKHIFDEKKAERPIEFIERFCKHSKGEWAGHAIKLELFQKAYISALFGFIDKDTGLRRFRETLFMVGRKNGKSTLLAGIALYMLIGDHEPGAEIYSVATKKDQARIIFDETRNMVSQSPQLRSLIRKRKTDLYCDSVMGKMQALGKNSDTLDGLNSNCVIMDELHGVRDRNLYEVLKQSQSARRQPLMIMITTAGTIRECIFDDMYTYAKNIIDGTVKDDTFLPVIYELDKREEWKNPKAWQKANPGLGSIKKVEDLEVKVNRAKNSPNDLKGILVKDFNIRETSASVWLSFDEINNERDYQIERFYNSYAIGGADLSITTDLTCATLLMMDKETEERFVSQMYWIPEDLLETRVKEDKIPYDIWEKKGLLRLCSGNCINYSDVTAWFLEMVNEKGITPAWIYYDSYSAKYWVEEMEQYGFNMIRCIQGAKTLSLPMQQLGADLRAKKINYNNNPILKWCLTNTGIQTDRNGNIVPVKAQSPKRRIDGTASLLDAYVGLVDHYNEFKNAL